MVWFFKRIGELEIWKMKNIVINIFLTVLCICALVLNYMDVYKEVGLVCIMLLGVIPLLKDKKSKDKKR